MTLSPGSKLGPYEILSSIGSGGMGEVWKARDTRLGRVVAIKKVKEQHSERFKQEARSIAALNHPNICQIFDIGDDYLVLEYVEGKPLSSPLPEQEAVRLAIQIATALEEAHQRGIIHRDLKPTNIMVTDKGSVKLLDFGLAKLYEQDRSISNLPTEDFPATQAGAILGTVAYMSPEQAQGQPADVRSDIFSFGIVLYEMLSGKRAFSGDSNYAVMDAIVKKAPHPLQTSSSLEKIVKRCLEKNPTERYQTMDELKEALEKAVKPKVVVSSEEPQPSIAVLPFVNMSGDKEQEYFSDGLAEEIINALTQIPGLKVAGRTSSVYFRDKDVEFEEIGKRLRVDHILEGSVRKAGNRLRITAQLIKVSDGFHLWSERYDREMTDVFEIQDEISQTITRKLRVRLSGDRLLVKRHTDNVEAYNLYLKGRYHFLKLAPDSLAKSKEYFEQAIALDPNYARAWFGMALFYWFHGYSGTMSPTEAYAQFINAIIKALELDEVLPEARGLMAISHTMKFDWKAAERDFLRALELGPEVWDVWMQYSRWYLTPMRRLDEAVVAMQKALDLDPLSPLLHYNLGMVYFEMRQYDRAIEQFRNALELDPHYFWTHLFLGISYIQIGRSDEGTRAIEAAAQLKDRRALTRGLLGFACARADRIGETQKMLAELHEQAQNEYVPALAFACIYQGLGEIDKAFDWLEKAVDEFSAWFLELHGVPIFDTLRSHPRYKALLRKMNLEP